MRKKMRNTICFNITLKEREGDKNTIGLASDRAPSVFSYEVKKPRTK